MQDFPAQSNVLGQFQEPTLEGSTLKSSPVRLALALD